MLNGNSIRLSFNALRARARLFHAYNPDIMSNKGYDNLCENSLQKTLYFLKKLLPRILFLIVLPLTLLSSQLTILANPQITIVWGTSTNSSATLISDENNSALDAGIPGNGDGDLVELGYFSTSNEWIPLTQNTHVGDSSSGYGFGDGMFIFTTNFYKNSDTITIFPTENKEFFETLDEPITSFNPPAGTKLWIRFYNSPTKGGAKYNTVSGDQWTWPNFPNGTSPPSNLYLKIAEGSQPASSSWNYGSTFEDESNRFKTSLSPTYSIGIAYSEYSYGDGNFTDINGTDYSWGDIIDLNASPADHSYFMGWSGSGITDPWNENTTLIVNGDQTIYAEFAKTPYLLDIESQIGGSVSPGGSFSYDFDTHVSVIATPEPGYHFKHWQWHDSGSSWFWEQNITQLGSLIYDLNNSSDIEELNATYKDLTGYYSIIENNNLIELVPVQFDDSNNSWAAIADILPASIEKNKAELKEWLDNKGYTPIEKNPSLSFQLKGETRLIAVFEKNTYYATISLLADDYIEAGKVLILDGARNPIFEWNSSNWGVTTPNQILKHGDNYSLRVVAFDRYDFLQGWWGTEDQLDMLDYPTFFETNFIPVKDLNLFANFSFRNYKLIVQSTGSYSDITPTQIQSSLIVDANHTVVPNLVSIFVEPDVGFAFERWHDPYGILTSIYSKETEANMSDIYSYDYDIAITAMLNIKTYDNLDVIIDLNESEGNYTLESDPGGGFSHFSSYSLSASPKLGFEFENWEGDSVDKLLFDSNEINNQILIDGNVSLTAVFKPKVYNLNLDSEGMGWVEGPDNFTINEDNFVVVAHNFQGYRFTHWSGDTNYLSDIFTNETNRTLTWGRVDNAENLPKDLSLTAHFVPETHQILVSSKVGGSIDYFLEGNYSIVNDEEGNLTISADSETRVGLIAFTDPGWKFSNWVTNSFDISDLNDSVAIFYPTDDANFSANFQPIEYNSSQVSITSSSGGEIEWDVTEFLGLEPSQYTFLHFEDYNISAIPDTGYRFIGWNGEGGTTQLSYAITNPINELVVGGPISLVAEFELIEYPSDQISITPNDSSYGAVEYESNSNGNMTHFGEYLLRATPKPGYHFVYWSINESSLSYFIGDGNSTEITLRAEGEATIEAHFSPIVYSVSLSSSEGGSISSPIDFNFTIENDPFIKAEENDGWDFSHWTGNIEFLENNTSSETLIVWQNAENLPSNLSFQANFIPELYSLEISADGIDLGEGKVDIVTGTNQFTDQLSKVVEVNSQSSIELNATASEGSYFSHWSGLPNPSSLLNQDHHLSETSPYIYYTPSEDGNLTAHFKRIDYNNSQIQVSHDSNGNVVLQSNDADKYTHFDEYQLTAIPNIGYKFSHWEGDGNVTQLVNGPDSSSNLLKVEGPISLKAHFEILSYNIAYITEGNGSTTGPSSFTVLDTPIISAHSSNGWRFTGWSGNQADSFLPNLQSREVPIQWSANTPPIDLSLTATFVPEEYQLNFDVSGDGLIYLTLNENQPISISSPNYQEIDSQTKISLTESATFGWVFSHWSGLPSESSLWNQDYSINSSADSVYYYPANDHNITAHFTLLEYNSTDIFIESSSGGSISISAEESGKYKHFSTYELNATTWKGYKFDYWDLDPGVGSKSDILEDIYDSTNRLSVEGPISITAKFSKINYSLNIDTAGEGEVDGPISFNVSDSPIITAQDARGWDFSHWTGDVEYLQNPSSAQTNIIFPDSIPIKDLLLTANFVREKYPFSIDTNGSGTFSILLDGDNKGASLSDFNATVESNTSIQVQAIPSDGWRFSRWIGLPSTSELLYPSDLVNTSSLIDYVPPGPNSLSAKFVRNTFSLEINSSKPFQGSAVGSGFYEFEKIVDINATPSEHFLFEKWEGDTAHLLYNSTSAENSLVVPSYNISIRPNFKPKIYTIKTFNTDALGEITVKGTYDDKESVNQIEYNATSEVILLFEPKNSYTHMLRDVYWTNSNGDEGLHFGSRFDLNSLDANYSFWANFTDRRKIKYDMIALNSNQGNVYENRAASSEQIQNIVATPNEGFSFIGWKSQASETFQPHWSSHDVLTSLNDDSEISGHFITNRFYPFVEYNDSIGLVDGIVSSISSDEEINLLAKPKENYVFKNWDLIKEIDYNISKGSSSINDNEIRVFINDMESPELNLVRGFTYHFHCNLQDDEKFFLSSSRNVSQEFDYNTGAESNRISKGTLTFTVPENAPDTLYYHLSESPYLGNRLNIISADLDELLPFPNNSIYSASLSYDFGLLANFEPTRHLFSAEPEPQSKGTVSWSTQDIYFWGDYINISASPEPHWKFDRWSGSSHITDPSSAQSTILIQEDTNLVAHFSKIDYPLLVNAIPEEYGDVLSLNGYSLNYEDEISLEVNPKIGKQFDRWQYNNKHLQIVEEENSQQTKFKVLAEGLVLGDSISISAEFSKIPIQIGRQIITQNGSKENIDETGGEILSPETIYHGDEVTFVFKEFEGFRFINWKDSEGNLISVQNTITQVITEHDTLYALVEKNEYQLDLTNNGNGHAKVSVNNQPPFEWNDSINIIAVPDDHWEFVRWIGLGIEDVLDPKSASTHINIKKDSNLTAEFKRKDYDLNVNITPLGYGSATLSPNKNSYHYGDIVNLVVYPSPNRKLFEKWENEENLSFVNDTGEFDKNISLKIEGNAYISAKLYSQKYTIAKQVVVVDSQDNEKILNKFGGSISGNTTHFDGEDGNYSIILNDGYKLLWWKDLETNETLSTEASLTYSDFDKNLSLAAYVTDRIYKIDIQLSPSMRGVLRWGNSDIQGNSFSENSKFGEIINFSATPHDNYKFSHWNIIEGDNIAYRVFSDSVTKSVSNDLQIAGYLAPTNDIEIIINSEPKDAAAFISGDGVFDYNLAHTIIAKPKRNYEFSHWEWSNEYLFIADLNSSTTTITLDGDKNLTAVFKLKPEISDPADDPNKLFLLSVISNDSSYGEVSKSGLKLRGTYTIEATPKLGHVFSHWEGNAISDINSPVTTVDLQQSEVVEAHFLKLYQLNVYTTDQTRGQVFGSDLTLGWKSIEAVAYDGYEFSHWEGTLVDNFKNGDIYLQNTQVNVYEEMNIYAHFQSIAGFDDSEPLDNDWWGNPWFGYYWKFGQEDWLLHEDLGWIYMKKHGDASIWVWVQKLESWLWTAKEHYPYLYSENSASWYWVNVNQSDFTRLVLFNFGSANPGWETH